MSEQGWRAFLVADGVGDWVVLHGGATAVFRTGSLTGSADLAADIARLPGAEGVRLTSTVDRLVVRLCTGVFRLEEHHIDLARAVSAVASSHAAVADRTAVHEVQVAVAAKPDEIDVAFWRAVLGYRGQDEDDAQDPSAFGSTFWMQPLDPDRPLRHAMHIDVSVAREQAASRLAAAIAAGGRIVDDSAAPEWWVLADHAGNRVCIASWPDGAVAPGDAA